MEIRQPIRLRSVSVRHKQWFLIERRLFEIMISLAGLLAYFITADSWGCLTLQITIIRIRSSGYR